MTRMSIAALGAVLIVSACAPADITSRLDTADSLYAGFKPADDYAPQPIGTRTENDFMRFSTMGVPQ